MPTLDDVTRIACALQGVTMGVRYGSDTWKVEEKVFAWVRPFSKADIKRYAGEPHPPGDIIALSVLDLADKEAVLSAGHRGVFTIPHFDGFAAVLVEVAAVSEPVLEELLVDAWMTCAPPDDVASYLERAEPT